MKQLAPFRNRKFRLLFVILSALIVILLFYVQSFDTIEPVCNKKDERETFLLNYVSKKGLKEKIWIHNKDFALKGEKYSRVYLMHPILEIKDPIFGDEYDYKPHGCDGYDVMDIYCIVDFSRLNGKVKATYRFME